MYKLKVGNRYKLAWHKKRYKQAVTFNSLQGIIYDRNPYIEDFKYRIDSKVCFSKLLRVMYEEM